MTIESGADTYAQPDSKCNPNPKPTSKQHAVVNISTKYSYISR